MIKYILFIFIFIYIFCNNLFAQNPILNSLPGANYVVYLDFDGHTVAGTIWNSSYNSGNPIYCATSGYSITNRTTVFDMVAEDFRPFNINITTDSAVFLAAPSMQKVRVVLTPTQSWYPSSAGGVANVNSFTNITNNICFVFTGSLGSASNAGEASSHEVGHTLGLNHHSEYNGSCIKTNEYHYGIGGGEASWAPIMGVGYNRNLTIWNNGAANFGCQIPQSDLERIIATSNRGVAFNADEHGNTIATATPLIPIANNFSDSGIITTTTDVDVFKITILTPSTININAIPMNFGANNTKANLDILISVADAAGNEIYTENPLTTLNANISNLLLSPGDYFISIDGASSDYQNGYGSLGKYFLTGDLTTPISTAVAANFIVNKKEVCRNNAVYFTDQSTGNNTSWLWTFAGGTPATFNGQTPGLVSFSTPGNYAVSLTVSDGVNTDTKTIANYISVKGLPIINISPTSPIVCGGQTALITASGALTYSWSPIANLNNTTLNSVNVSGIASNTTYTVVGTDGFGCSNTKSVLVQYALPPTLVKSPTDNPIYFCRNDSVLLSISGASTYVWSPATGLSATTGSSVKASSPIATNLFYNVTGTSLLGCKSTAYFNLKSRACDSLAADISVINNLLCVGDSAQFSDFSTGNPTQWQWTFDGGTPSTSNVQNPGFVKYNTVGSYNVTLKSIKLLDTSTRVFNNAVVVGSYPVLSITPNAPSICPGDSVTLTAGTAQSYLWNTDSTITGRTNSASIRVGPTNTTTYYVTGKNNIGGQGGPIGGTGGEAKTCNTLDSVTVTIGACTLPLNIINFKAFLFGSNAIINWEMPTNFTFNNFILDRSIDGINFTPLATIAKNSNGLAYYQYFDNTLPRENIIYYRLKTISLNGDFKISEIVYILKNSFSANTIGSWPNPVVDNLYLRLKSTTAKTIPVIITNILGSKMATYYKPVFIGDNNLSFNMSSFVAGVYFITINNEGVIEKLKIIKQ